jgi:thioredoxin 1
VHFDRHPAKFLQTLVSQRNTRRWQQPIAAYEENGMAENGKTKAVTDASWSDEIEKSKGLSLVDFWAAWCGPCRMVAPVVEQLATEYEGKLKVAKMDVDANQVTAMKFNIRSIPSILFFKDGKLIDTVVGAVPKALLDRKIQEHLK